ncbi:polysaccharide biosynthesis/export family protein [Rhodopseudomonas sp.]|uniref:polysaccharide biosynthesis/export family protein n=1 Tax=Rhodopseudomonas sp. TaxID=1078 RepID=UPI003B3BB97D
MKEDDGTLHVAPSSWGWIIVNGVQRAMGIFEQDGHVSPAAILLAVGVSGAAVLGGAAMKNANDFVAVAAAAPTTMPDTSSAEVMRSTSSAALAAGQPATELPKMPVATEAGNSTAFAIGDRVKLAFYERMAVEDDKWGRGASAMRGIVQRPEMSGEYAVQEDGTVALPLIGSIPAAGRSLQQFVASVAESSEQILGHKLMVNIVSLERAPVYVLGPVKNSGSFKYASGITVLHAVALAGGLDRGSNDSYMKIETVREIQRRSGAAGSMLKLLARLSVLKAERDGVAPRVPPQLMELVGAADAKTLIEEQIERRKPLLLARQERQRAMTGAIEAAKQDLELYGRTETLDQLVKTRQERVDNMRALVERNVLSKAVLSQVQGELSDAEQRRQDSLNQYGMAKQRLTGMQADALKVQSDLKNELAVEIDAIERQLSENEREFRTSEGILSSLPSMRSQVSFTKRASDINYSIVRQSSKGPITIQSDGMTLLQPGDLVSVTLGASDSIQGEPAVLAPAPPQAPAPAVPIGLRSTDKKVARD